jgi:flagellar motor switch protein FliG
MNDLSELDAKGLERAAILLMSLDADAASNVMKHLNPRDVQKLGAAMAAIQNVPKEKVHYIMHDFLDEANAGTSIGVGKEEYIRNVMQGALGRDKADNFIDSILTGPGVETLESLKWLDAKSISEIIRFEHPQVQALVLSSVDSEVAAQVLTVLDETTRSDLILRIATQDKVHPSVLRELNQIIEESFSTATASGQSSSVGGVRVAADVLNLLEKSVESNIMNTIKEVDEALANQLQDLMFVFEDLKNLEDRGMQTILREIDTETLIFALKGSDDEMQAKVFKNMSKRAAEMLREDMEVKGPVRIAEVEQAQRMILNVALRMSEAGEIVLNPKGGEEMIS